jgi:hypothetical protein
VAFAHQQEFRLVRWREDSKGKMSSRFARLRVQPAHGYVEGEAPGKQVWLLIEWPENEPEPLLLQQSKRFFDLLPQAILPLDLCGLSFQLIRHKVTLAILDDSHFLIHWLEIASRLSVALWPFL